MLYWMLRLVILILPYGLVLSIYKNNNALPANIHTRSGRFLKAIMITENYGILVSKKVYIDNKAKLLMEKQKQLNEANEKLAKEFNSLSFDLREEIFNSTEKEL